MVVWGSVVSQVTYLGRALCLYLFLKCSCDLRGRVLGTVCAVGWARSPGLAEDPHGRPTSPLDPAQPFVPARSPRNLGVRPLTDPIRHAQGRKRGSRTAPPPSLCLRVAVCTARHTVVLGCCPLPGHTQPGMSPLTPGDTKFLSPSPLPHSPPLRLKVRLRTHHL